MNKGEQNWKPTLFLDPAARRGLGQATAAKVEADGGQSHNLLGPEAGIWSQDG